MNHIYIVWLRVEYTFVVKKCINAVRFVARQEYNNFLVECSIL